MSVTSLFSKDELIQMLRNDKAFRDTFVLEFVRNNIPIQLKALRKERDWTQDDLGREANKPRNVITRLENPNSHVPNLATLYEIAVGCKAALLVKIVPFSELLKEYDKPFSNYFAPSIDSESESVALTEWATAFDDPDDELDTETTKTLALVSSNPNTSNQGTLRFAEPLRLVSNNNAVQIDVANSSVSNADVQNFRLVKRG